MRSSRQPRAPIATAARGATGVLAAVLAGCLSNRPGPSLWPPDDFYLEVRGYRMNEDGSRREQQRFQVWADRVAVYRESDRDLIDGAWRVPVFHRVSAYLMHPKSVRTLGRRLERAGLFDLENDVEADFNRPGEQVAVYWRAFRNEGFANTDRLSPGGLDRALHIINAFLPEGRSFGYADLTGESEPRHLNEVPEPHDSVRGAYAIQRKLAQLHPDDPNLRLDLFAVAVEAGDLDIASAMVRVLETMEPEAALAGVFGGESWNADALAVLRRIVEARQTANGR